MLLPSTETHARAANAPLMIALHWLGGSARTWQPLARQLASGGITTAALNLPGFGDAVDLPGYSVAQMATAASATIRTLLAETPGRPWLLAGHSMGGKIAAVIAREALDGAAGLEGLRGVVLFSPSPPQPEPMKESVREDNLKQLGHSTGDADEDRQRAKKFVEDNVGKPALLETIETITVDDLLRMNRSAFRAWMNLGSREDWSAEVGMLQVPALIFAGESEAALGPDVQQKVALPHWPQGSLMPFAKAGHLIPLERTTAAADAVLKFVAGLGLLPAISSELTSEFKDLLQSRRVSDWTRAVLQKRLEPDTAEQNDLRLELYRVLQALVETIIPDVGFDIASRVNTTLRAKQGEGWRFASLPSGPEAWRRGLLSLDAAAQRDHGRSFAALAPEERRAMLDTAAEGKLGHTVLGALHLRDESELFTAAQMKDWFTSARGTITRLYMCDPRTYERVGYTGFADDPAGFTNITLGSIGKNENEAA